MPERCPRYWAASLLALALLVTAGSPGSPTRLRGPRRATNASSALQFVQPGVASNEVARRPPAPRAPDRRRRLSNYVQLAKLTASGTPPGDYFGSSVAIDGATVVVGAYGDDDSGSAYVFSLPALDENSALGSDSATRAGGTLATALLAFAATALAL